MSACPTVRTECTRSETTSNLPPGKVDVGAPTPGMDSGVARDFYDKWGDSYEQSVNEWGYNMPAKISSTLAKHVQDNTCCNIVDAGCGDGLSGLALRENGLTLSKLTGIDLSPKLLDIADARGVYQSLAEADLSQPLVFADNTFDALACVGVLTYLQPASGVLAQFARVCKPGGFVCFNIRTDHVQHWSDALNSVDWELVSRSEPLPYLPNNPEYGEKVKTVIFCYRV